MPKNSQIIENPNFARDGKGWTFIHASVTGDRRRSVELLGGIKGEEPYSALAKILSDVPSQHFFHFSCDLRKQKIEGNIMIEIYAVDENETVLAAWTDCWHAFPEKWTTYNSHFVTPPKTTSLWVWVRNYREDSAYVRKPSLTIGKAANTTRTTSGGSTVILEANYKAAVLAEQGSSKGSLYLPIPGNYDGQIPFCFELSTNPKKALIDWKIYQREDEINWVCKADLNVGECVTVNWKALVVVKGEKKRRIKKTLLQPPKEISQWLRSTEAVQSKDAAIRKKARAIVNGTNDIKEQADRIMKFCVKQPFPEKLQAMDAKTALTVGGSCTSRANLGAALLRAIGVPARTIAHLPVSAHWCDMHWLTEYWQPGYGWITIETSLDQFAPPSNRRIVLSISSADDEEKSRDPIHLRTVLPGAPYLSISLVSPELGLGYGYRQNFAAEVAQVAGTNLQMDEFLRLSEISFEQLTKSSSKTSRNAMATSDIIEALKTGKASRLSAALRMRNRIEKRHQHA